MRFVSTHRALGWERSGLSTLSDLQSSISQQANGGYGVDLTESAELLEDIPHPKVHCHKASIRQEVRVLKVYSCVVGLAPEEVVGYDVPVRFDLVGVHEALDFLDC